MKLKFNDKNELYTFLEKNDLMGLDSEYSLSTQKVHYGFVMFVIEIKVRL